MARRRSIITGMVAAVVGLGVLSAAPVYAASAAQTWTGAITGQLTAPGCDVPEPSLSGTLHLSVKPDHSVRGSGEWTQVSYECGGQTVDPVTFPFTLKGRRAVHQGVKRFELTLGGGFPGTLIMDIHGKDAAGEVDVPGAGGYGSKMRFDVKCTARCKQT